MSIGGTGEVARLWATVGADVGEFLNKMDQVERQARDTGGMVEAALDQMGRVSAYATLGLMGRETVELARMGAEADRMATAFENLANTDADRMLDRMRDAARGTISDMEMMQAANKAMMLGVTDDADQMGRLLEVASARGRAMGLSASQAFSDIVTGIGRGSPMILDNLGIVGAQQALDTYATSAGKTADELSDLEKKQALLNKVLNDTTTAALATGQALDQLGQFERISAQGRNIRGSAGQLVGLSGIGEGAGLLGDALEGIANWLDNMARGEREVAKFQAQVQALAEAGKLTDEEWRRLMLDSMHLKQEIDLFGKSAEDASLEIAHMKALDPSIAEAFAEAADEAERLRDAIAPPSFAGLAPTEQWSKIKEIIGPALDVMSNVQGWQNTMGQRAIDADNEAAAGATRKREQATREWERQQEQAANRMRSMVEGILSPTSVTMGDMWHTQGGGYGDKWDEYARRIRSAVQDPMSAWKGLVPGDVMGGGDVAKQGWLEEELARFYNGQIPGAVDWGGFDRQWADAQAKQAAREALIAQAMARTGGALGHTEAAGLLGLQVSPGEAVVSSFNEAAAKVDIGKPITDAFEQQIMGEEDRWAKMGSTAMGWFAKGAENGVTPATGRKIARALFPFFAEMLPEERP